MQVADDVLVARCLRGDEAAWTQVWERYGSLVKAVARRAGCTDEESRDVLQQAALVALERLVSLRERAKLGPWLAGIGRHCALATVRRRRHHQEIDDGDVIEPSDVHRDLERDELLALLRRAFVELEPRCQRLLRRLELTEPAASYQEVASDEGLAPTSVGPIRRRCLDRLRKLLERVSRPAGSAHYQEEEA